MSLTRGARLGPYEIADRIGAGGMGEVYRARDTRLRRDVAVKVLLGRAALDPSRIHRFELEARAAGQLAHPGIVAVFDIGTHEGSPFVVTELLEGETLRDRLRRGALPAREAADRAGELAAALSAAHARGVVHRDLKPENLFLTRDGRLKVLDFGVAKLTLRDDEGGGLGSASTVSLGTEPGAILGTAGYMAPEQVRGHAVDHRADLFAAGAILYEMLTGDAAFEGDSSIERMNAILKEEPRALAAPEPGADALAESLFGVAHRCLRKDPAERYASADELARAIAGAVAGGTGSRPAPLRAGAPAPAPRPARARAIGAVAAAAMVVAGFLAIRASSAPSPGPSPVPGPTAVASATAGPVEPPVYRQLTFQRGSIASARFTVDGHSVIYGACWGAGRLELYSGRAGGPSSLALGVQADVLSVSTRDEAAVSLGRRHLWWPEEGKLAVVPVGGGAPRELLESVQAADWSKDGEGLFLARRVGARVRLEDPAHKVLYETDGWISDVRVSRDGARVAFVHHPQAMDDMGDVMVTEASGDADTALATGWMSVQGLAWSPSGDEIWFTAASKEAPYALHGVDLAGKQRVVLRAPGRIVLHDALPDGKVLLARNDERASIMARAPGDTAERDLSTVELSVAVDIDAAGEHVLISEQSSTGRPGYDVYVRDARNPSAVSLGGGHATALSPDGKWALAIADGGRLALVPTGVGSTRTVGEGLEHVDASFFPDGRTVLALASEPGKGRRYWSEPIDGGAARPLTPEGMHLEARASTDGDRFAFRGADGGLWVHPAGGGEGRRAADLDRADVLAGWEKGGRSVIVLRRGERPARAEAIELATGRRSPWKTFVPADPTGFVEVSKLVTTPDGRGYAYTYFRKLSTLYLVTGLR